ncbi:hypothetical protein DSM03_1011043 [Leeuwenhoekiella aestuarii]|uniref:Carboxypeptidase-like protein n=1 Tax=Leeuwenhoekiella aestuarii TaxID=2249426 RepID=A0A4Q0P061_9FLAO|nr:hypothetical protein [Leeuwenhoekiella aestuarii]RXG18361.1 hypothetical protein DSM04_101554 [Leeuwenhoekiella aestuarii]RXG19666.1 hypothetical protein DSM03_1011043 [Leeuwenhoekiella aestuarii]
MLKRYTILLIIFIAHYSFSQETLVIKVIDQDSENPIYGASLKINNTFVNFSNKNGEIKIDTKDIIQRNDTQYCFSHMSYDTECLTYKELKVLNTVSLKYQLNELDEVLLTYNSATPSNKEIIKRAKNFFKESLDRGSYWSKINLKEVWMMYDVPQSYLEIDGTIFMNYDYSPKAMFWADFIIPNKVRRIEESTTLKRNDLDSKRKKGIIQKSVHFVGKDLLFAYRTYLKLHPLGKKSNRFFINFLDEEEIRGNKYYVIEYSRNENLNIKGRGFSKNYGKIWISKKDYSIFKEQISFHFETLKSFTMNIDHTTYENKSYPTKIESISHSSKLEKAVSTKSILMFEEIAPSHRDFLENDGTGISFLYKNYPYTKDYWNAKPANINPFQSEIETLVRTENSDDIFTNGNLSPIYDNENKVTKYWYSINKDKWDIVNRLYEKDFKNAMNTIKIN